MNMPDIFYIITMPLGLFSSILDTSRIIKTRSAKSRSITSYALALFLVASFTLRSAFSVTDFLFTLNGILILLVNGFQLAIIIKWRKQ